MSREPGRNLAVHRSLVCPIVFALTAASAAAAQSSAPAKPAMDDMPEISMPAHTQLPAAPPVDHQMGNMPMSPAKPMSMSGPMTAHDLIGVILNHTSSGTSVEPASTPVPMLMTQRGAWMVMLHGLAFAADTQQHAERDPAGPSPLQCIQNKLSCPDTRHRGADKLFSTNWIMPMAMRQFGPASHRSQITIRTMLSLEPATVTSRQYPELFQQGETAFGTPIVDGQHPHDFWMEVAALYDLETSAHSLLSFYAAPVGDPAIGPTAYPHRLSASEDPVAALGHHQEDSTHIAFNVLTAGLTWRAFRFEESGFHGAEPTEGHWHLQPSPNGHAIDSYSSRLTVAPSNNWAAQYSWAHITSPEALYPGEDQQRQTASVMYNRPLTAGNLAVTLLWGRTRSLAGTAKENSYLAEALWRFHASNYLWTRLENAGRSNELLLGPSTPLPSSFTESPIGHVAAYTAGYDHDLHIVPHLITAPGAQFTSYSTPSALHSVYGAHPFGVVAFVRFRITSK